MSEIYIHLGLPRTGTTFLQRNVFPKLDLHYVSKPGAIMGGRFKDVLSMKGKVLLSNENWSGTLYRDTHYERYATLQYFYDTYPNAHIMIGTRNPQSWLKSVQNNQFKKEPRTPLDEYDKEMLNFDTYIKTIQTFFDDVFIYNYEDFKKDNKLWVKKICEWLEVPVPNDIVYKIVNKSWSKQQIMLVHFIKKVKKYGFERILGGM